jgi:hypothetical protein
MIASTAEAGARWKRDFKEVLLTSKGAKIGGVLRNYVEEASG